MAEAAWESCRFDTPEQLEAAAKNGIALGLDSTGIVQEFIPARDGHITRGGDYRPTNTSTELRFLLPARRLIFARWIFAKTNDGADIKTVCVVEGPKTGLKLEAYTPPPQVISDVERIFRETTIEVGGAEYIIDDRDGQLYYYDINALSNFCF